MQEEGIVGLLLAALGEQITVEALINEIELNDRLDARIDRLLKRLFQVKAAKQMIGLASRSHDFPLQLGSWRHPRHGAGAEMHPPASAAQTPRLQRAPSVLLASSSNETTRCSFAKRNGGRQLSPDRCSSSLPPRRSPCH